MDRETKELLTSMEKLNNRMLVDLSRVLAADQGKADARAAEIIAAQRGTTMAVIFVVVLLIVLSALAAGVIAFGLKSHG